MAVETIYSCFYTFSHLHFWILSIPINRTLKAHMMFSHTWGGRSNIRYIWDISIRSNVRTGWLTDVTMLINEVKTYRYLMMSIYIYALPVIQELSWAGLLYKMHFFEYMKSYFKPVTVSGMAWVLFKLLSQRKSCGNCVVVKNWGKRRAALPFLWTGCSASSAQLLLWDSHGLLQIFSLSTTHPSRQSRSRSGAGGGSLLHLLVNELQVGSTPAHDSAAIPQL